MSELEPSAVGTAEHRALVLREAAAICRAFADALLEEEGPSSETPDYDSALCCAELIESLARKVTSGEPRTLALCGMIPATREGRGLDLLMELRLDAGCAVLSEEVVEAYEPKWRVLLARIYEAMRAPVARNSS